MIKIEIEIDAQKVREDNRWTPESIMRCLDDNFNSKGFPILEADEFRRVYRDSGNDSKDYGRIGGLVIRLSKKDWFMPYASKILWYDNFESDNETDWNIEDFRDTILNYKVYGI